MRTGFRPATRQRAQHPLLATGTTLRDNRSDAERSSGGKTCLANLPHRGAVPDENPFPPGWTSVTGGVKPTFLKDHGHTVFNPKLAEEAVQIAQDEFDKHKPHVVVGSSRGGAVAMNI